jgi:hypothetical protein
MKINNKRFVMILIFLSVWLIVGVLAIIKNISLVDLAAYYSVGAAPLMTWFISEGKRPSGDYEKQSS